MHYLNKDDNFNDICSDRTFFRQDSMTSVIVYHFANRSGRMFQQELLQQKTYKLIHDKNNNRYCPEIVEWVRRAFYATMTDEEFKKLSEDIITVDSGDYQITVSEEEQTVRQSHFLRFMRLQSLIEVQWYTTMTVK